MQPFEHVVAEHGAVVWRVCRALLGPDDADDAWSDTFVAAMRAYADMRPGSDVRGWLVTIAYRKALDVLRATGRAPVPMDELPHPPSRDGIPEPPDDELRLALAALAPKQRAAVLYHYIAGLPYADVAALIECTEAAARRSAADGIAKLRKSYGRRSTR